MNEKKRNLNLEKIIGIILFAILFISMIYSIYKFVVVPFESKSNYSLMLIQSILGLVVMFIPSILERRLHLIIPNYMYILYFVFLFCSIYLGEIHNFYYLIPYWDVIMHALSAGMLGSLGFIVCRELSDSSHVGVQLNPIFIAFFAFCFALAVGAIWEIYEYLSDEFLLVNMQKFRLPDGTLLVGHAALADTMKDIIVDALGALIISVIGYFSIRLKKSKTKDT
ncbi:MAG: hypothetical protein WCQ41_02175 [Bacillota bacterium]